MSSMYRFFCQTILVVLFVVGTIISSLGQTLPYTFKNNSAYADNEIYIGLVGKFPGMGDVWMNMLTSQLKTMSYSDNTVAGPAWSNTPDGKNKYAAIFFKLSDITNKTINIPQGLFGCRIFISFKSPMYIYFHQTGGYAGANLQNASDPNDGIRWELVELTWGDAGLWTNTSRVDAYQYPMGLEVTGFSGGMTGTYAQSYNAKVNSGASPNVNAKIGELLTHQTILDLWTTNVDASFYGCKTIKTHSMDNQPIIEQPSKIPDFKPGATYGNYFAAYIDDIWSTYRNKDLYLNIGDRGTWRGRVTGDRFDFYDPADNSQATIYSKPTTTDAIEGSGALATTQATAPSQKYDEDLMIQAQVCAAINRHAIYTNAAVGEVQYNVDETRYFKFAPFNQYVNFFHNSQISYNSKTYAFAYDDVGDHSSTIQCTFPTKVLVVIGGYGTDNGPVANAGIDQSVLDTNKNGNESLTLDASLSTDKTGTIVDYIWKEGNTQIATGIKPTVNLSIGIHTITVIITDNAGKTSSDEVKITVLPNGQTAFKTLTIPGTIEAEDYDYGGQNISYYDTQTGNIAGAGVYRQDDVDIESNSTGYHVSYIADKEWTEYTIASIESGIYTINLLSTSNNAITTKNIAVSLNGISLGSVTPTLTGSWNSNWQTLTLSNIQITGGTNQVLRLSFSGGEFNVDKAIFIQDAKIDCNGDLNGTAYKDNCNTCVGGKTGLNPCATQTLVLNAGWNLVSFNVATTNQSIASVFADVMANIATIKNQQAFYSPTLPLYLNSLTIIDLTDAYLVKMNKADTIILQGSVPNVLSKQLHSGWNLCGYPKQSKIDLTTELNSINTNLLVTKNFDGFYIPGSASNSIKEMIPGDGYFIKVSKDCMLNY
jgi:hypothetical protein